MNRQDTIRNFCIIAHIDHGKSTLADRLIEKTQNVFDAGDGRSPSGPDGFERERGITSNLQAVRMIHEKGWQKIHI